MKVHSISSSLFVFCSFVRSFIRSFVGNFENQNRNGDGEYKENAKNSCKQIKLPLTWWLSQQTSWNCFMHRVL